MFAFIPERKKETEVCKTYLISVQMEITCDEPFADDDAVKEFVEEIVERAQVSDDRFVSVDTAEVLGYLDD